MAFNPTPQVAVARDFAKKFGADRVVIYFVKPDGQYGYASYGKTKELCKQAGCVADKTFAAMGEAFVREEEN